MGRGDQRSKKGKIRAGSYGNSRKKKSTKKSTPAAAESKQATKKAVKK